MDIDLLRSVVREASALMVDRPEKVMQKEGYENIVTSSDVNVQNFLKEELSRLMPGSGFLCEEEDMHDLRHECVWIIDPIDGTANYARGLQHCAISVALARNGRVEMGAVYLPRTGEMFSAQRGAGAFLNGAPLHVSGRVFADSILFTALPVYHKEHTAECAAIIAEAFARCNDVRRLGAAAPELCYVAAGRCDLYFEYLLSPWDFAAASLILEEAGGALLRPDGLPIDPAKPSGVIAANSAENLSALAEITKKHLK
ncbi:MAG: inositol monophosphatase [Clostridium sp.]|nr:inositol monophosphatase [Clostridium sp.]